MSCKYDNSMYTTNPPKVLVESETINPTNMVTDEEIDNHIAEEQYYLEGIACEMAIEEEYLNELIKYGNKNSEC